MIDVALVIFGILFLIIVMLVSASVKVIQTGEYFFDTVLGINNYCPDIKAGLFQIPSGFLIHRFVFRIDFLPVQVLF